MRNLYQHSTVFLRFHVLFLINSAHDRCVPMFGPRNDRLTLMSMRTQRAWKLPAVYTLGERTGKRGSRRLACSFSTVNGPTPVIDAAYRIVDSLGKTSLDPSLRLFKLLVQLLDRREIVIRSREYDVCDTSLWHRNRVIAEPIQCYSSRLWDMAIPPFFLTIECQPSLVRDMKLGTACSSWWLSDSNRIIPIRNNPDLLCRR